MKITLWNKGKKPVYVHEMNAKRLQQYGADVATK